MTRTTRRGSRVAAAGAALALLLAGCGDDDDTAATTTTEAEAEDDGGVQSEYCALAVETNEQEEFPSADQVRRYQELAPEEIQDAVAVAAPPLIEAEGDPVAAFAAFADDEVEAAIEEIEAFEADECGIERGDDGGPEGEQQAEAGAAVVDVVAVEYDFQIDEPVAAGRTSLRLTNEGQEAHFLIVAKIAEGHTLQEVLEFEGDAEEAGLVEPGGGESGLAAPGGEDEEFVTLDLEAGTYGMVCFVPGPDGTPHAFTGMAKEFTVS